MLKQTDQPDPQPRGTMIDIPDTRSTWMRQITNWETPHVTGCPDPEAR